MENPIFADSRAMGTKSIFMNFKKTNNITGWLVFFIAFAVYFLTREARGSLWDTGEFISSADKMQLPHPPGAPMFVLLGRFFIILFGDNKLAAANAVNLMSALASAATILFLFWSITHFARKMYVTVGEQLSSNQMFTTMAAGAVGALAYAFSDSFWFSAVEGEVYALSSFFTALVFWAMLKWEHADEKAGIDPNARTRSDRWIVFLFFMMGLSIGVHLLNLLSIPAIVMIYFFRRNYKHEESKADYEKVKKDGFLIWTVLGTILVSLLLIVFGYNNREGDPAKFAYILGAIGFIVAVIRLYMKYPGLRKIATAFFIGCLVTGLTQLGVIQYSMKSAGLFDVFFVNKLGMPFFSGFAFYFLAISILIIVALRFNEKTVSKLKLVIWFAIFLVLSAFPFIITLGSDGLKIIKFLLIGGVGWAAGYFIKPSALRVLKLGLWCYAFMLLGYSMYFTALIRSNANPAIDMNNVDNPINLVYYLSREQYGEAPLVYGPHFAATPSQEDLNEDNPIKQGEMVYVKGKTKYIKIGPKQSYNYKNSVKQIFPRIWDGSHDQFHDDFYADWLDLGKDQQTGKFEAPSYGDNMNWFFTYQMGLMYWRYFMWNFSGKQNDIQGLGNKRDGNWISGISFIDNSRLGNQAKIPDSIKNNKAHNRLYLIPLLLGILGCIYQFFRNRRDWVVNFLLFFMTGIAVVIYLNQPGNQPRERDYAYVGSFYVFAIWIGLAVVALTRLAQEKSNSLNFQYIIIRGSVLTFIITLMSCANDVRGGALMTSIFITVLFAAVTAGLAYLIRALSSGAKNERAASIAATVICLLAPLIMLQQEWDDHDRSQKTTAPDIAKDYLESCAPNAVLFTFGDNDTYPLWYAQEVEGVRTDIRVINNSLLGIDWYINQLRYKVNEADSLDVLWSPEQIEGHNREYLQYRAEGDPAKYYDLYDVMKNVLGRQSIDEETGRDVGYRSFPVAKFTVPVDTALVRTNGTTKANDVVLSEMQFEIPESKLREGLVRSDFIILNFIASNKWKRPIYFTSPFGELGFGQYLRKDGLSYRLVPVQGKSPQENWLVHRTLRQVGLGGTQIRDLNDDVIFNNLMTKYLYGAKPNSNVYFDEENRRHILGLRELYGEAAGNLADEGRKDEALKLLAKCEAGISAKNLPYAMVSRFGSHNQNSLVYLEACYKAGDSVLAEKYRLAIRKDLEQQRSYFISMNGGDKPVVSQYGSDENKPLFKSLSTEYQINEALLAVLGEVEKKYAPDKAEKTPAENITPTITNTIKPDSNKVDSNK